MPILITGKFTPSGGAGAFKLYDWAEIYPIEFFYRASTTPKKRMGKEIVISNFKISTS